MKAKDKEFFRGYALAIGYLIKAHGEDGLAEEIMREHGITLKDLEDAECDFFDIEPIRAFFHEKQKFYMELNG